MRILMVLDKPYPPDLRVENEVRSLQRAGHDVAVLSLSPDRTVSSPHASHGPEPGHAVPDADSRPAEARRHPVAAPVFRRRVPRTAVHWMRGLAATIPALTWFGAREIERVARQFRPDAIHVHDLYLAGAGVRAARRLGARLVVDLHEHWLEVLDDYRWSSGFPRRLIVGRRRWRAAARRWLPAADLVVVINEEMAAEYAACGVPRARLVPVPNLVDLDGYGGWAPDPARVAELAERPVVLYVGGLVPNRGLDLAIRAMPSVAARVRGAELVIVGDGTERAALETLAESLGAPVQFAGWVDPTAIPSWVHGSAVCIHPMRRTRQTDLALSHKLYQYMLAERPVVVTDCPAMARVVRDAECGVVVADGDQAAFADAVAGLLLDPERASRLGAAGRRAVLDRYHWDRGVQPLLEAYDSFAVPGSGDPAGGSTAAKPGRRIDGPARAAAGGKTGT